MRYIIVFLFATSTVLHARQLVLRDVTVIPMTADTMLPHRTIVIDSERIKQIKPFEPGETFSNADVINGAGRYVMPGMWEMHAHLPYGHPTQPLLTTYFNQCLAAGVTGIRSMRGRREHLALRDSIRRKQILAPDLVLSELLPTRDSGWDGTAIRAFVLQAKKEGWNFLKYLGGISPAVCDSCVKICDEFDMKIAGHTLNRSIRRSVDANFASIEHYNDFVALYKTDSIEYDNVINDMIARSIYFCPTLAWSYVNGYQFTEEQLCSTNGMNLVDTALVTLWKKDYHDSKQAAMKDTAKFYAMVERTAGDLKLFNRLLKRFVNAGGKLLCGPEPSQFLVPGFSVVEELQLFCNAGLTPYQALKTATVEPAAMFRFAHAIGTVEEGKRANLVMLKSNPLESIDNLKSVEATVLGGKYLQSEK